MFDPATIIASIALVLIVFFAVRYIYLEKKRGTRCIGCPMAGSCDKHTVAEHNASNRSVEDLAKEMQAALAEHKA